jgi:hypothetical protein
MIPHFRSSAGFVRSGNSKTKLGVLLRGMRINLCAGVCLKSGFAGLPSEPPP